MTIQDTEVYARIENSKILEYPVFPIHIKNRAHPQEWYTKVIFYDKPVVPEYHNLSEVMSVVDGKVYCNYTVKSFTLAEMLNKIHANPDRSNPMSVYVADIENIPVEAIAKVNELARGYVQTCLDEFAATRGYDGILSVCSYVTDPLEEHRLEGQRAVELRSLSWAAVSTYLGKVMTKVMPVPRTVAEIHAELPVLTW